MESYVLTENISTSSENSLTNSAIWESSENSPKSVADVALRLKDTSEVWITLGRTLQGKYSESCEHLQKSPYGAAGVALQCAIPGRTLEPISDADCKGITSKTSENSKNSLSGETGVGE